jgi:transcription initiation factor TFIIB
MRNYYQKITVLYTMEELTANIWSDVDHLLNKNKIQKSVDKNLCNICKIPKVITREGFPTCPECGLIDSTMFIDDTPEWTSGVIRRW